MFILDSNHYNLRFYPSFNHFGAAQHRVFLVATRKNLLAISESETDLMTGLAIANDRRAVAPRPPLGWSFLAVPDDTGSWAWPSLAQSLKNQIIIILKTRAGEQLMNPDFGAGLENYFHEPDGVVIRARIRELIAESLAAWENRIVIDAISVDASTVDARELLISISYRANFNAEPQVMALAMPLGGA